MFRFTSIIFLGLASALFGCSMQYIYSQTWPTFFDRCKTYATWEDNPLCQNGPQDVALVDVIAGLDSGSIILVDVRNESELIEPGKIPGSYNIPLFKVSEAFALSSEEFEKLFKFAKPSPEQLVITCRSGSRAETAWNIIRQFGYCSSRIYKGSFTEWASKALPIEKLQSRSDS